MAMKTTQTEYFISKAGEQLGPWAMDEIARRVGAQEIAVTDFVFDESAGDWIALFECQAFKAQLAQAKPKTAPAPRAQAAPTPAKLEVVKAPMAATQQEDVGDQWFVQRGEHRYGPFTYLGVIKALQEKTIYEFDLIAKGLEGKWTRIAEHDRFQQDAIRSLKETSREAQESFVRRKHPRIPYETEVMVHDNRNVWLGRTIEASVGGSALIIENATLVPGQTVMLHFSGQEGLPAFNATCEIVSKKYVKEIQNAKSPVQYAVRFVKVDSGAQDNVEEFFLRSTGAKAAA